MSASNDKARNAPTHAHVCTSTRCMQDQSSWKVPSVSFDVEGYISPVPSSCIALQGRQAAVVSSSDLQQLKYLHSRHIASHMLLMLSLQRVHESPRPLHR